MNKKTMQIVIVLVCLALAGVIVAYYMGAFGQSGPPAVGEPGPGDSGPVMQPVKPNAE